MWVAAVLAGELVAVAVVLVREATVGVTTPLTGVSRVN
jgi:hypothetical protein